MWVYNGFSDVVNLDQVQHITLIGDNSGNVNAYLVGVEDPIVLDMGPTDAGAQNAVKRLVQAVDSGDFGD